MSVGQTCDTSVLVPALVSWHPEHDKARMSLRSGVDQVPAHVLLECYSVLTRLPAPHRLAPADAARLVSGLEVEAIGLPGDGHGSLISDLGRGGLRGGATYDALVAATALRHDLQLVTRDRRARATYDAVGVSYVLV